MSAISATHTFRGGFGFLMVFGALWLLVLALMVGTAAANGNWQALPGVLAGMGLAAAIVAVPGLLFALRFKVEVGPSGVTYTRALGRTVKVPLHDVTRARFVVAYPVGGGPAVSGARLAVAREARRLAAEGVDFECEPTARVPMALRLERSSAPPLDIALKPLRSRRDVKRLHDAVRALGLHDATDGKPARTSPFP